jgi:predicted nicotinamide N-methyase
MPQIVNKKSVLEMAMGAIAEITDYEVERVVANIMDPNTNATAKRNIAAYLGEQLADLVERGSVVVMI